MESTASHSGRIGRGTLVSFEPIRLQVSPRSTFLFFRLHVDTRATGLGEASFGGADEEVTAAAADLWRRCLKGQEVASIGVLQEALRAALPSAPTVTQATALSGLEQALWDLRGQQLGLPVYELFGGARRRRLRLYANINRGVADRSSDGYAAAAVRACAQGFTAVKCAPFDEMMPQYPGRAAGSVDPGVQRVMAIRQAIGADVELMVDCHGRLTEELAVQTAKQLEPVDLRWFEEPVSVYQTRDIGETRSHGVAEVTYVGSRAGLGHVDGLARVATQIRHQLAGGEYLYGVAQFEALLSLGAVKYVMPDVKHCGGLFEMVRIAAVAAAHGVVVSPHNPSGPVATVASGHVGAALPEFDLLEYQWGDVPWRCELLDPPEPVERDHLVLSEAPGLGIRLNDKLVRQYQIDIE